MYVPPASVYGMREDAGEDLDGAFARLLLDLLPVRDRAALLRQAECVREAGGRDQGAESLVVAGLGRGQQRGVGLGDGGRQSGRGPCDRLRLRHRLRRGRRLGARVRLRDGRRLSPAAGGQGESADENEERAAHALSSEGSAQQ